MAEPLSPESVARVAATPAIQRLQKIFSLTDFKAIQLHGAKLEPVTGVLNIDNVRKGTSLAAKINGEKQETNLVDFLLADSSIQQMLLRAMSENAINVEQIKAAGLTVPQAQVGVEKSQKLTVSEPLTNMQKAEALALILQNVGKNNLIEQIMQQMNKEVKRTGPFSSNAFVQRDYLNALTAAGGQALTDAIREKLYSQYQITGEDSTRRKVSNIVDSAEDLTKSRVQLSRVTEDEGMKIFTPEYPSELQESASVDLKAAQMMFDILLPPEEFFNMQNLALQIEQETDVQKKENLHHQVVKRRQMAYIAILQAKGVQGYERDSQMIRDLVQKGVLTAEDVVEIQGDKKKKGLADKVTKRIKASEKLTLHDANIESMVDFFTSQLTTRRSAAVETLVRGALAPIEISNNTLARIEKQLSDENFPLPRRRMEAYNRLWNQLKRNFEDQGLRFAKGETPEEAQAIEESMRRFFQDRVRTELGMTERKADRATGFKDPSKVQLSAVDDWGLKGLDLLFRRTLSTKVYEDVADFDEKTRTILKRMAEATAPQRETKVVVKQEATRQLDVETRRLLEFLERDLPKMDMEQVRPEQVGNLTQAIEKVISTQLRAGQEPSTIVLNALGALVVSPRKELQQAGDIVFRSILGEAARTPAERAIVEQFLPTMLEKLRQNPERLQEVVDAINQQVGNTGTLPEIRRELQKLVEQYAPLEEPGEKLAPPPPSILPPATPTATVTPLAPPPLTAAPTGAPAPTVPRGEPVPRPPAAPPPAEYKARRTQINGQERLVIDVPGTTAPRVLPEGKSLDVAIAEAERWQKAQPQEPGLQKTLNALRALKAQEAKPAAPAETEFDITKAYTPEFSILVNLTPIRPGEALYAVNPETRKGADGQEVTFTHVTVPLLHIDLNYKATADRRSSEALLNKLAEKAAAEKRADLTIQKAEISSPDSSKEHTLHAKGLAFGDVEFKGKAKNLVVHDLSAGGITLGDAADVELVDAHLTKEGIPVVIGAGSYLRCDNPTLDEMVRTKAVVSLVAQSTIQHYVPGARLKSLSGYRGEGNYLIKEENGEYRLEKIATGGTRPTAPPQPPVTSPPYTEPLQTSPFPADARPPVAAAPAVVTPPTTSHQPPVTPSPSPSPTPPPVSRPPASLGEDVADDGSEGKKAVRQLITDSFRRVASQFTGRGARIPAEAAEAGVPVSATIRDQDLAGMNLDTQRRAELDQKFHVLLDDLISFESETAKTAFLGVLRRSDELFIDYRERSLNDPDRVEATYLLGRLLLHELPKDANPAQQAQLEAVKHSIIARVMPLFEVPESESIAALTQSSFLSRAFGYALARDISHLSGEEIIFEPFNERQIAPRETARLAKQYFVQRLFDSSKNSDEATTALEKLVDTRDEIRDGLVAYFRSLYRPELKYTKDDQTIDALRTIIELFDKLGAKGVRPPAYLENPRDIIQSLEEYGFSREVALRSAIGIFMLPDNPSTAQLKDALARNLDGYAKRLRETNGTENFAGKLVKEYPAPAALFVNEAQHYAKTYSEAHRPNVLKMALAVSSRRATYVGMDAFGLDYRNLDSLITVLAEQLDIRHIKILINDLKNPLTLNKNLYDRIIRNDATDQIPAPSETLSALVRIDASAPELSDIQIAQIHIVESINIALTQLVFQDITNNITNIIAQEGVVEAFQLYKRRFNERNRKSLDRNPFAKAFPQLDAALKAEEKAKKRSGTARLGSRPTE